MSEIPPIVITECGPIRGRCSEGVDLFIEIPYGASTAGRARFTRSVLPQPWTDVREAITWTNRTPQYLDTGVGRTPRQWYAIQGDYYAPGMDEDSLTLNIWTPDAREGGRRPVLVWIHGGAYTVGHAGSEMSDGAHIAARQDVVFVSVTHRLNAFGFLDVSGVAGDEYAGSGNNALMDIIDALGWVSRNISAFGGDPGNVTLMGESGGGAKVSTLLAMPEATGLFHRAMMQSGVSLGASTPEEHLVYAERLIAELGGTDASALFDASTDALLDAQLAVERAHPDWSPRPVVDGVHLHGTQQTRWLEAGMPDVPVLLGSTRDEVTVFGTEDLDIDIEVPAAYHHGAGRGEAGPFELQGGDATVSALAGKDASAVISVRRDAHPAESEYDRTQRLIGDLIFRRPGVVLAERWAERGRLAFVYRLDWTSPRLGARGAPHSSAVSFFFDNTDRVHFARGLDDAAALAGATSAAFAAFARSGWPQADGLSDWPAYDLADRSVMILDSPPHVVSDPEAEVRRALEDLQPASLL